MGASMNIGAGLQTRMTLRSCGGGGHPPALGPTGGSCHPCRDMRRFSAVD